MRLLFILISFVILIGLFMLLFNRYYPANPSNSSVQLDTSLPSVNRQVEDLQNTTQKYNDTIQKQQRPLHFGHFFQRIILILPYILLV